MRRTVHLVALILAWLAAACAPTVEVAFEERDLLSQYRTWDWCPDAPSIVDATPSEGPGLHVRLSQLIEEALRARGFERTRHAPDFFVTYHLELRRRIEIASVPFAPYLLSSHHSSPSYLIEGTRTEKRLNQDVRLSITVTEGGGRTVWQAALQRRVEGHSAVKLDDAVAILLEQFPRRGLPAE